MFIWKYPFEALVSPNFFTSGVNGENSLTIFCSFRAGA